ncbi:MAG: response regulator transcription factor [Sphingobacteriales bacterium]|nr:MAG: response regulator transcription factor [Sphingobacteriales bacterium]
MSASSSLPAPPKVIVVTAYHEYALRGYELNVVDYLLKPVEWSRFVAAVNKVAQPAAAESGRGAAPAERPYLFFNVNKRKVRVYLDEILYVESLREYIRISTPALSFLTRYPLSELEALLAEQNFLRIHRSFIVSLDKIDTYSATDVEIGGKQLPIGRNYRDEVRAALGCV